MHFTVGELGPISVDLMTQNNDLIHKYNSTRLLNIKMEALKDKKYKINIQYWPSVTIISTPNDVSAFVLERWQIVCPSCIASSDKNVVQRELIF